MVVGFAVVANAQDYLYSHPLYAAENATDAANDLIADLTLSYNKARQEKITKELLDIAAGANALAA